MLTDLQRKWLDALKSGDYKQAKGSLRTSSGYCCLGVACDIVDPDGWNGDKHTGQKSYLPEHVARKLGMNVKPCVNLSRDEAWGRGDYDDRPVALSWLNDRRDWSFTEIAELIEAHAEEIFHDK